MAGFGRPLLRILGTDVGEANLALGILAKRAKFLPSALAPFEFPLFWSNCSLSVRDWGHRPLGFGQI
jgi:hypothetical protein